MTVGEFRKMLEAWPDDAELEWSANGNVLDLGSIDVVGYLDDGPETLVQHVDFNTRYDRLDPMEPVGDAFYDFVKGDDKDH